MVEAVPSSSPSRSKKKPKSGVVIPHRAKWQQRLAALLVVTLIRCIGATVRFTLDDATGFFSGPPTKRFIFAVWHNRLALSAQLYDHFVSRYLPERRLAAMVSASRDGGLLARILELFEIEPVRGSSSRRGSQALREMVTWGERGYDLAITPDGPRGPCYIVQEGVISTAQLTGLPIVPVSYYLNWKFRLKSWDRFLVPLPFTRCEIRTGRPFYVARELSDAERETIRADLEKELRTITRDD